MATECRRNENLRNLFNNILFTHPAFDNPLNEAIRNFLFVGVAVILFFIPPMLNRNLGEFIFPPVSVAISNDGPHEIWFMCQTPGKDDKLYQLMPKETFSFGFNHIGYPRRWCYIYVNPDTHGFFWAYTVRSRCQKCFWSVDTHISLYREDRNRWERQSLYKADDVNKKKVSQIQELTLPW